MSTGTAPKRRRVDGEGLPDATHDDVEYQHVPSSNVNSSTDRNFRNLSTCNRCRIRKHRCDQRLPQCRNCEKVDASCVGFDPVTKKEIPRSYVYYLEGRVATLTGILDDRGIEYPVADAPTLLPLTFRSQVVGGDRNAAVPPTEHALDRPVNEVLESSDMPQTSRSADTSRLPKLDSGISFARIVASSVRRPAAASSDVSLTAMLDGHFQAAPDFQKNVSLPGRSLGSRLIRLYLQNSNSMYPILDRRQLEERAEKSYASEPLDPWDQYILRMVFAIGSGLYLTTDIDESAEFALNEQPADEAVTYRAEDYHASAMPYLDACLILNAHDYVQAALNELQAVLLLAAYALLRPTAPGLWYIVGIAIRRALDLGLHNESSQASLGSRTQPEQNEDRIQLKRRLWWCAYSFDRLISSCVGRPCNVPDDVITTAFPSLSDGVQDSVSDPALAKDQTYCSRDVAHHYFRLRILQSEVLQVTQSVQAQHVRNKHAKEDHQASMHSAFLFRFENFRYWQQDIDHRLRGWVNSAPLEAVAGGTFPPELFELNYWQSIVMLNQQAIYITESTHEHSDAYSQPEEKSTLDDLYLALCEASQNVLRLYRELHLMHLVNYAFLDTHQIFSAVWHSAKILDRTSVSEIDLHVLMATSVLDDLVDKCSHAAACRDTLRQLSKSTIRKSRSHPTQANYKSPFLHAPKSRSTGNDRESIVTQTQGANAIGPPWSAAVQTGSQTAAAESVPDIGRLYGLNASETISLHGTEGAGAAVSAPFIPANRIASTTGSAHVADPLWNFDANSSTDTNAIMFGSFFFSGWSDKAKDK